MSKQQKQTDEKLFQRTKVNTVVDEDPLGIDDEPGIGHNGGPAIDVGGVAGKRLQTIIDRIERLEEEKSATMEDIKEVYSEAKGTGFDTKTIRKMISRRKKDREELREEDELLDLYELSISGINSMME